MSLRIKHSWVPWVLYPAGDLVAQLITGEFNLYRLLILSVVGGLIYQFEVPLWFRWLDHRTIATEQVGQYPVLKWLTTPQDNRYRLNWFGRTLGAMLYFSPIWIVRHMVFLKLATAPFTHIAWLLTIQSLWKASCMSFVVNMPFSLLGNYMIQARLPLKYRFLGSIIMTGLFSIAYALAYKFF